MSSGEAAYLTLVVAAFVIFMAAVAGTSWWVNR